MPIFRLDDSLLFPPVYLAEPEGLLAIEGDLRPERLVRAYASGIFPWYNEGEPILWWSPDPRAVLRTDSVRVQKSMRPVLRAVAEGRRYRLTADKAFSRVVESCRRASRPGQEGGTWITAEMQKAYAELHRQGVAHSVEVWNLESGELAGGLYGVSTGSLFAGESMFALERDASKLALIHLCRRMASLGIPLIDCQIQNPHLAYMGAEEISRDEFMQVLHELGSKPAPVELWEWD